MNREILIGFLKEHEKVCPRSSLSRRLESRGGCFLCTHINRDTLLLISRMDGARESVDIGFAYPPVAELDAYKPYVAAGFKAYAQVGANEKERIENIFDNAFSNGYDLVVVLAYGVPNIPPCYLDEALLSLRKGTDLVLGPLKNGKFYLIGMNNKAHAILKETMLIKHLDFEGPDKRKQILRMIKSSGISCRILPEWYTLKSFHDFKRLMRDTAKGIGWKARWTRFVADNLTR